MYILVYRTEWTKRFKGKTKKIENYMLIYIALSHLIPKYTRRAFNTSKIHTVRDPPWQISRVERGWEDLKSDAEHCKYWRNLTSILQTLPFYRKNTVKHLRYFCTFKLILFLYDHQRKLPLNIFKFFFKSRYTQQKYSIVIF